MTPRSFWAIILKILGIYSILQGLVHIPEFLGSFYATLNTLFSQPNSSDGVDYTLLEVLYFSVTICFDGLILWVTLFKTDWLIDKLKLDKGFEDERFEFNIHRSTILKIVIMVTGGWLLVDSLPYLCKDILDYFRKINQYSTFRQNPDSGFIILFFVKSFIGYFMLTCSRMIINFMEARRRKSVVVEKDVVK